MNETVPFNYGLPKIMEEWSFSMNNIPPDNAK